MSRNPRTLLPAIGPLLAIVILSSSTTSRGQAPLPQTLSDFSRLNATELDALFASGRTVGFPAGSIRGMALVAPGSPIAGPASKSTRLVWQGKIVNETGDSAVNRFFGLPLVRSCLRVEPSWFDGAPCLILDYSQTSLVYRNVRDEVREVAPGLYLGRMYATAPCPHFRRYFALQVDPCTTP